MLVQAAWSYRKRPQIVVVADASELVGFLWAVLRDLPALEAQPAGDRAW